MGDFNIASAPLVRFGKKKPHNPVTSVSPAGLGKKQVQEAYPWIDTAYSAVRKPGETAPIEEMSHAQVQQLNAKTGKIYPAGAPPVIDTSRMTAIQKETVERLRLIPALDPFYKTEKLINNELTIFEYEKELREAYNDRENEPFIFVRRAINLKGEMGFGIALKTEIYHYLACIKEPELELCLDTNKFRGEDFGVVYVKDNNLAKLRQVLTPTPMQQKLIQFAQKITDLERSKTIPFAQLKADGLKAILRTIYHDPNREQEPYPTVIDHFMGVADEVKNGGLITTDQIQKSQKDLDEKLDPQLHSKKQLHGKKSMSRAAKAIIGAVFGLLAGAVIGLAIGTAITLATGGGGAVLGATLMVLTMAEGAKIGSMVALGTLAAGALLGFGSGFFAGTRANNKYESFCKNLKDAENNFYTTLKKQ